MFTDCFVEQDTSYAVSTKSKPPKHFAITSVNRHRFKQKFNTYYMTSIWVTNTKFYRNLSFCLRDFHSLFKVISWICVSRTTYFFYWLMSFLVDKQTRFGFENSVKKINV